MRTVVAKFRTKFNFSFTLIISGWGFNGFQQGKMRAKRTNELPFVGGRRGSGVGGGVQPLMSSGRGTVRNVGAK